jgi:hypothetical protein
MVSSYEMYKYYNHLGMFSHICFIISKTVRCVLDINYNIHLFLLLLSELFFPLTFQKLHSAASQIVRVTQIKFWCGQKI